MLRATVQIVESDLLFRNHEVIAPSKSKAIQKLLIKLYKELRSVAGQLVTAFAIPDIILRAPIGTTTFVNAQDTRLYDGYLQSAGFDLREMF
jgi:acyl-CoA oxidase